MSIACLREQEGGDTIGDRPGQIQGGIGWGQLQGDGAAIGNVVARSPQGNDFGGQKIRIGDRFS